MANRKFDNLFEVTWTKDGDRGTDEPLTVEADSFNDSSQGFVDFWAYFNGSPNRVLRLRASDVQSVRMILDES